MKRGLEDLKGIPPDYSIVVSFSIRLCLNQTLTTHYKLIECHQNLLLIVCEHYVRLHHGSVESACILRSISCNCFTYAPTLIPAFCMSVFSMRPRSRALLTSFGMRLSTMAFQSSLPSIDLATAAGSDSARRTTGMIFRPSCSSQG